MRHRLAITALAALGLGLTPASLPAAEAASAAGGMTAAEATGGVAYSAVEDSDPFEAINRRIDGFNQILFGRLIDPAFAAYATHVPASLREGVANVFRNLQHPFSVANSALAGEWALSRHYFQRFTINATFGLLGVADVATKVGVLELKPFGFGDVLCAYDVPPGPYLVLPVLGPASVRTGVGHAVDLATAAVATGDFHEAYLAGVHFHDYEAGRSALRAVEAMAIEPYAAVRSAVRQVETICGPLR